MHMDQALLEFQLYRRKIRSFSSGARSGMFRSRAQGEVTSREAARKIFSRASVERLDRNRNRGTLDNQYLEVRRVSESWNIFHAAPITFCSVLCSSSLWVDQRAISLNPGIVTTSTYILYARVSVVNQLCEFRKQNFQKLIIIIIAKVISTDLSRSILSCTSSKK